MSKNLQSLFSQKEKVYIILVFAVLLFAFFWFELRPYFAKQACLNYADKLSRSGSQPFETTYTHCLLRKGY